MSTVHRPVIQSVNVPHVESLLRTVRPTLLSETHPFPLAQQFVSRLLPLGHAKSARSDDAHFLATFEASPKWLRFDTERA